MKVLVTGAEGFIGKNLVERLLAGNHAILYPKREELDLIDDVMVTQYFERHDIDCIVHAATTLRQGTTYPADTCENNLRMFFNLVRCKKPEAKLINLGSGSEYDRSHWHQKMHEDFFDKNIPKDPHSYAKYLISKYIQEHGGENISCFRIFGVFGKYEDYRYKFISNAIVKNIFSLPIVINQNVRFDYLCIHDVARIIEAFMQKGNNFRIYNMTPTESVDLVGIAKIINSISEYESDIVVLNPGLGVEYTGDNARLLSDLGSFKFSEIRQSVSDLMNYYEEIKSTLDYSAIVADDYLNYAKDLRQNFFLKSNEK